MFDSIEYTASGKSYLKIQGAPGKTFNSKVDVEQKFKLFVASTGEELVQNLEKLGLEAKRKNFVTQTKYSFFTVCRVSEEENAALGIFINLERFNGKLPTFCFIEAVGNGIAADLQKMKFFGEGTVRNELTMSLLSDIYEKSYAALNRIDEYCMGG